MDCKKHGSVRTDGYRINPHIGPMLCRHLVQQSSQLKFLWKKIRPINNKDEFQNPELSEILRDSGSGQRLSLFKELSQPHPSMIGVAYVFVKDKDAGWFHLNSDGNVRWCKTAPNNSSEEYHHPVLASLLGDLRSGHLNFTKPAFVAAEKDIGSVKSSGDEGGFCSKQHEKGKLEIEDGSRWVLG